MYEAMFVYIELKIWLWWENLRDYKCYF